MKHGTTFQLGNYIWRVQYVSPNDPILVDRTGRICLATTDPTTNTVYIANCLSGELLSRVLIHELGHCAIISFNLLDYIHSFTKPEDWVLAEEWICNFIADYGYEIYTKAYEILGDSAIIFIPPHLEALLNP